MPERQIKKPFRPGSWLAVNTPLDMVGEVDRNFRLHILGHFIPTGKVHERNFQFLRRFFKFDLGAFLERRLKNKSVLSVLDAGAGFYGISSDIKREFGSRVHVTAVNLTKIQLPRDPAKLRQLILRSSQRRHELISQIMGQTSEYVAPKDRYIEYQIERLKEAEENSKLVDEIRVTPIENFHSEKRFDVIVDLAGSGNILCSLNGLMKYTAMCSHQTE